MTTKNNKKNIKIVKLFFCFATTTILLIITLPYGILLYILADSEYFWSDYYENKPPPKYFIKYCLFLKSPFKLLKQ